MKHFIVLVLSLTFLQGRAQFKKEIPSLIASCLSGVCEGTAETLKWHYDRFERRFPNANPNFWNPKYSGDNKYRDGLRSSGPRFPGSTTILVGLTDGYHAVRTVRNFTIGTAIALHPGNKKKKFYIYLLDIGCHVVAYQIGFNSTYYLLFK